MDAIKLLRDDHGAVRDLFKGFGDLAERLADTPFGRPRL
jgi:hypothetical protein